MQTIAARYADFIVHTGYEDLDETVIFQVKKLLLDFIGVSLAGYKMMEFPRIMMDYVSDMGGAPEASLLHLKNKVPAANAALANACCAHALDMDDGHRFGALHPGSAVIPAALAAAELSDRKTQDLIAGIVAGYEVMIRIGMAIALSSLNRGFHLTGTAGTFGAAATAGSIMGLNRTEMAGALGMAGLQSSGLLQVNHEAEGAKVKPLNPAKAAMSGVLACHLAQRGARGPFTIFEGRHGFLRAFADEVNSDLLIRGLGKNFEILRVYHKLYAACRHTHPSIEAASDAFKKSGQDISAITKIDVATYPSAVEIAGNRNIKTPSAARFSIPFSVALALYKGAVTAYSFCNENVGDQAIQALAEKVTLKADKKWEELYPRQRGATVKLHDNDGRTWIAEVGLPKGEPENPVSWEELKDKFHTNATSLISDTDADNLAEVIIDLENRSLRELIEFT